VSGRIGSGSEACEAGHEAATSTSCCQFEYFAQAFERQFRSTTSPADRSHLWERSHAAIRDPWAPVKRHLSCRTL